VIDHVYGKVSRQVADAIVVPPAWRARAPKPKPKT